MQVNLENRPLLLDNLMIRQKVHRMVKEISQKNQIKVLIPREDWTHAELQIYIEDLYNFAYTTYNRRERCVAASILLELAFNGNVLLPYNRPSLSTFAEDSRFTVPDFLDQIANYVHGSWRNTWAAGDYLTLLLATDCRKVEDFSLIDFEKLHDVISKSDQDVPLSLSQPAYALLEAIEHCNDSPLSKEERHRYILWRFSKMDKLMSFNEFSQNPENYRQMRVHGIKRERVELARDMERRHARERQYSAATTRRNGPPLFLQNLFDIAKSDSSDAPSAYFGAIYRGGNKKGFRPDYWLESPTNYPGRAHVRVSEIGKIWFVAVTEYLRHRARDYESEENVRRFLTILVDYVLLYLPWWFEKNPNAKIDFPYSPKKFNRFVFVDRTRFSETDEIDVSTLPCTLYSLLPSRLPTIESRNSARNMFAKFFKFIITYFEDDDKFSGPEMKNPIRPDFDNEVSSRPSKTNKPAIKRHAYPFLVHFCQSIEAFGEYLQQRALLDDTFRNYKHPPVEGYDTSSWGYIPIFRYAGILHQVKNIPSVFRVTQRTMFTNPPGPAGIYVNGWRVNAGSNLSKTINFPCLTGFRILEGLVDTGFRGQTQQWLDRRTFDSLAEPLTSLHELYHGGPLEQTYHRIFLNTDKSHSPWDSIVSWRVRRSMLTEKFWQESLNEKYVHEEVYYEGRKNSRFGLILPLFKRHDGPNPISDGEYRLKWITLLHGFEEFFNSIEEVVRANDGERVRFVTTRDKPSSATKQIYAHFDAIYTPHSCRVTFATNRDGDFETAEIAALIGHSNPISTGHYQVPDMDRLIAKIMRFEKAIYAGPNIDDILSEHAFIQTEKKDSPVRKTFDKSREQAISSFGFVAGSALWSIGDLHKNSDSLKYLRESPTSSIRWHSTHICPVGNECPEEVIAKVGEKYRCGCCPLAAKCIDHLPAIYAKQLELLERIKMAAAKKKLLSEANRSEEELDKTHNQQILDTKEFVGWKLAADLLRAKQRSMANGDGLEFHADEPELVKRQLQFVSRNINESQFILERLVTSNAYPSLQSDEIRAKAAKLSRIILAKQGRLEDATLLAIEPFKEVATCIGFLLTYMRATRKTFTEIGNELKSLQNGTFNAIPMDNSFIAGE
jgi:hypothetical protein